MATLLRDDVQLLDLCALVPGEDLRDDVVQGHSQLVRHRCGRAVVVPREDVHLDPHFVQALYGLPGALLHPVGKTQDGHHAGIHGDEHRRLAQPLQGALLALHAIAQLDLPAPLDPSPRPHEDAAAEDHCADAVSRLLDERGHTRERAVSNQHALGPLNGGTRQGMVAPSLHRCGQPEVILKRIRDRVGFARGGRDVVVLGVWDGHHHPFERLRSLGLGRAAPGGLG